MKRTLRYISYTLMYLIISIASAYGVILLSAPSQDKNTEASVPKQITNIIEKIFPWRGLTNEVFALQSESLNASAEISLSASNIQNVAVSAEIDLTLNNQMTSAEFIYQNSTIYASLFNNKFQISSNNLISSIGQILSILNFGKILSIFPIDFLAFLYYDI